MRVSEARELHLLPVFYSRPVSDCYCWQKGLLDGYQEAKKDRWTFTVRPVREHRNQPNAAEPGRV